jgi:hypothetical protein
MHKAAAAFANGKKGVGCRGLGVGSGKKKGQGKGSRGRVQKKGEES